MADIGALLGGLGAGGAIGQAIVRLELDTAKYQTELKAAQAQTTAGAESMGSSWANLGAVAKGGAGAAALAVGAFAVSAVKAASDQGEALNKSKVIFENNADAIAEWAKGGADAFGLSATAALDAASNFGSMLQTAGLAVDKSADMSKALVQLAGDMASFNNIDPTEALEKLRSGLAGEAEPLRRFGVFLSEAEVKAEAYRSGIAKVGSELTEAQKVQARYNLILDQTTKQQGDFQRTSDSLANQQRILNAHWQDLQATLGRALLPAVEAAIDGLNDLATVLLFVTGQTEGFDKAVRDAALSLGHFELDIASWAEKFAGHIPIIDGAVDAWDRFRANQEAAEHQFDLTANQLDLVTRGLEQQGPSITAAREGFQAIARTFLNLPPILEKGRDGLVGIGGGAEKAKDKFDEFKLSLDDVATATDVSKREFIKFFRTLDENSRDLLTASRELLKEKWINPEFVEFLSTKGPGFLTEFTDLNTRKQMKFQEDWEESNRRTNQANRNIIDIIETLDRLGRGTTSHTVKIKYEYEGFDPTKPGMSAQGRTGRGGPQ